MQNKLVNEIRNRKKMYEKLDSEHSDAVKAHRMMYLDRMRQNLDVALYN
jgi:uncharacterized protein YnzC (UPF0291/DUF896 family)